MRAQRRHFEHLWRRTKLEIHRQLYVNARIAVTSWLCCQGQDPVLLWQPRKGRQSMFRLVRSLGGQQKVIYPEFLSQTECCDQFSAFFSEKVQNIRDSLDTLQCHGLHRDEMVCYDKPLASFEPISDEEVSKILAKTMKTCDLDPFPSTLLKGCHACIFGATFHKIDQYVLGWGRNADLPEGGFDPPTCQEIIPWTRTCSKITGLSAVCLSSPRWSRRWSLGSFCSTWTARTC